KGGRIVRIVDPKTGKAYTLDREDLTLSLVDDPDGLAVTLDGKGPVVLKRRGGQDADVQRGPPATPPAPAPPLLRAGLGGEWVVGGGRPKGWCVEDEELVTTGAGYLTGGYLLTKRSYSDFRLVFEFQLSAGANSGVALRAIPGERHATWKAVPEHLEVQILDD